MAEEEKPIEEAPETTPEPAVSDTPALETLQEEPVSKPENEPKSEETATVPEAEPTQETPTAQTVGDEPLPEGVKEASPEGAGAKAPAPKKETPTPKEARIASNQIR